MATNYPGSLDSITAVTGATLTSASVGGRTHSQLHNDTADAVEAVQAELGTDPAGTYATVKARLDATTPVVTGGSPGQLLKLNGSLVPTPDDFLHASVHGPGGADPIVTRAGNESANRAETIDRFAVNGQIPWTSGDVRFTYFTSNLNKSINRLRTFSGSAAYAAGTGGPHQTRLGLYTVDSDGDLTLVARTSQGLRWTTTHFAQEDAFDTTGGYPATYTLQYGLRYAIGIIYNLNGATGATMPELLRYESSAPNQAARGLLMSYSPRMAGLIAGQTDLPTSLAGFSSITSATFASSTLTVNTAAAHRLTASGLVTISGMTTAANNGTFTVASTPTSTQFTVTNASGVAQAGAGGTANGVANFYALYYVGLYNSADAGV